MSFSIRTDSDTNRPTSYPTHVAGPRVQRGPGCLTRTILGSQRRLLNSNAPSRLVPGLGTRRHKTRKIPRSGQNCSASKTPESVPLYAYVFTSNRGGSHGIYSQSRRYRFTWGIASCGDIRLRNEIRNETKEETVVGLDLFMTLRVIVRRGGTLWERESSCGC